MTPYTTKSKKQQKNNKKTTKTTDSRKQAEKDDRKIRRPNKSTKSKAKPFFYPFSLHNIAHFEKLIVLKHIGSKNKSENILTKAYKKNPFFQDGYQTQAKNKKPAH